jgi:hypothetical protein
VKESRRRWVVSYRIDPLHRDNRRFGCHSTCNSYGSNAITAGPPTVTDNPTSIDETRDRYATADVSDDAT